MIARICNLLLPLLRWEVESGISKVQRPAGMLYAVVSSKEILSQARRKKKIKDKPLRLSPDCHTRVLWHMCSYTRAHATYAVLELRNN